MPKAYPELKTEDNLVGRIVRAMLRKSYKVFTQPGEVNIVYVEGMNLDGTPNSNKPNQFNDIRTVFTFSPDGLPILLGKWEATTEPGKYYTENPLQPGGAARITLGQQSSWQVGMHRGDHEALIQTGGPVTITRDLNEDYKRIGDKVQTGWYGINQHWGYDYPVDDIKGSSAGCLVGRTKGGHREFMALVKRDPHYRDDNNFVYTTTVLASQEVT